MTHDEVRQRLSERPDDELLEILRRRDVDEWQPAVFDIASDILRSRGIDVPAAVAAGEPDVPEEEPPPVPVTIATCASEAESDACRAALETAGFRVFSGDEYILRLDPSLGPALGGYHLGVLPEEAEEARAFLAAAEAGALGEGLLECVKCGRADVSSSRHQPRTTSFLNALLGGPELVITYRCNQCGAEWR